MNDDSKTLGDIDEELREKEDVYAPGERESNFPDQDEFYLEDPDPEVETDGGMVVQQEVTVTEFYDEMSELHDDLFFEVNYEGETYLFEARKTTEDQGYLVGLFGNIHDVESELDNTPVERVDLEDDYSEDSTYELVEDLMDSYNGTFQDRMKAGSLQKDASQGEIREAVEAKEKQGNQNNSKNYETVEALPVN